MKRLPKFRLILSETDEHKILPARVGTILTKGHPDVLLERCEFIGKDTGIVPLDPTETEKIKKGAEFSGQGLRVLAFAYKESEGADHRKRKNDLSQADCHDGSAKTGSHSGGCRYKTQESAVAMITGSQNYRVRLQNSLEFIRKGIWL